MELKTKEKLMALAMDFADELAAISDEYDLWLALSDYDFWVENQKTTLDYLYKLVSVEEAMKYLIDNDRSVEEFTKGNDIDIEAIIFCGVEIHSVLYGYEAGQKYWEDCFENDAAEALNERLLEVINKHGYDVQLSREGLMMLFPRWDEEEE